MQLLLSHVLSSDQHSSSAVILLTFQLLFFITCICDTCRDVNIISVSLSRLCPLLYYSLLDVFMS